MKGLGTRPAGAATIETVDPAHHLVAALSGTIDAVTNLHTATDQLRKSVAGDRGVLLSGAVTRSLFGGASSRLQMSAGRLMGWSVQEATGQALKVLLHDGSDANGDVIAIVQAAAGVSVHPAWFGPGGIGFGNGIFAEVITGNCQGSFYFSGGPGQ